MRFWLFLHPLGFVYFSFILWHTLPLLYISPLCCHYLRLSRGFFCLMFITISFFFSILRFSFTAVALSGRFRFSLRDRFFSPSFYLPNYVFTSGSPCVAFALVVPTCGFHLRVIFLPSWSTPASVLDPIFDSRLVRLCFIVHLCPIIAIGYAFFFPLFLPSLPFFRSFRLLLRQFSVYPSSVLPDCVSLHTALLFFSP